MRRLYIYIHPSRRDWAYGYAAGNDIEDELEHEVIQTTLQPPERVFITDKTYHEMERSLREEMGPRD